MRRRILSGAIVATVAGLAAPGLHATAVIAFRTAERVILAADSRLTGLSVDGERSKPGATCKIVSSGGRWWVLSGGLMAAGGLDIPALYARAVATSGTMREALAELARAYRARVHPAFASAGPIVARNFDPGDTMIAVIVAGVERGTVPTVGYFSVTLKSQTPFAVDELSATCPGRLCPLNGRFAWSASVDSTMTDLIRADPPPAWLQKADTAAAYRLIQRQIEKTPDTVSAPISILELTTAGARWVTDPGSACAAEALR